MGAKKRNARWMHLFVVSGVHVVTVRPRRATRARARAARPRPILTPPAHCPPAVSCLCPTEVRPDMGIETMLLSLQEPTLVTKPILEVLARSAGSRRDLYAPPARPCAHAQLACAPPALACPGIRAQARLLPKHGAPPAAHAARARAHRMHRERVAAADRLTLFTPLLSPMYAERPPVGPPATPNLHRTRGKRLNVPLLCPAAPDVCAPRSRRCAPGFLLVDLAAIVGAPLGVIVRSCHGARRGPGRRAQEELLLFLLV